MYFIHVPGMLCAFMYYSITEGECKQQSNVGYWRVPYMVLTIVDINQSDFILYTAQRFGSNDLLCNYNFYFSFAALYMDYVHM